MENEIQDAGTGTAPEKIFGQADVDRIVTERLMREREKALSTQSELEKRLAAYEAEIEARKLAEMSEIEKIATERDKLAAKLEETQGLMTQIQIDHLKSNLINKSIPNLPDAYRRLVDGKTQDEISASIESVKSQYETDIGTIVPPARIGIVTQAPSDGSDGTTYDSPLQKLVASQASK